MYLSFLFNILPLFYRERNINIAIIISKANFYKNMFYISIHVLTQKCWKIDFRSRRQGSSLTLDPLLGSPSAFLPLFSRRKKLKKHIKNGPQSENYIINNMICYLTPAGSAYQFGHHFNLYLNCEPAKSFLRQRRQKYHY